MMRRLALAGLLALAPQGAYAACAAKDIAIRDFKWSRDAGWFVLNGVLVNACAEATGVQIKLTLRDEKGAVVSEEDAWPGGERNLPPGATPFRHQTRGYATAKDIAVVVSAVRQWPK